MSGTLEQYGDKWRLRFTRELAHPVDRVWQAIVDPEQRRAWFPDTAIGDFEELGGKLRFEHAGGAFEPFHGEVLAVEPPTLLEFSWGPDLIRIEIEPRGDGSVLTLLDTIEEVGKAARDGAGWHVCLDKLVLSLRDEAPPWTDEERWVGVNQDYRERLGPEASTIGPPPDAFNR
jgi:uncharacterized protein YndB with AHSA1/START domain